MSRELKIEAARAALDEVGEGIRLGIGTGSTADEFIRLLGEKVAEGFKIIGVPTSERTRKLCEELLIPITTLEEMPELDLVVDGADETDFDLNLIKGAGGALLREKIVAHASRRMIVIADDTKLVEQLGAFALPVEIDRFGREATRRAILSLADKLSMPVDLQLRGGGEKPYVTDGGHYIFDASFGHIRDANALSEGLNSIPGVVEHGLFLGYASLAFIAGRDGIRRISL